MTVKFLHLNMMFEAYYIDALIQYLKQHSFDIINLQEVAGGSLAEGRDIQKMLEDALPRYSNVFVTAHKLRQEKDSYFRNITFFKDSFSLVESHEIWLKPFFEVDEISRKTAADLSRAAIHVVLKCEDQQLHVVNTHLAWGPKPNDEPYKLEQAKVLLDYMKAHIASSSSEERSDESRSSRQARTIYKQTSPFIFSGDFNLISGSQVVRWFDGIGRNLSTENNVTNTLNPRTHKVPELFPPGLAVDYVYVSDDIQVKDFAVVEEDLSDHLGLRATFEI